ncbi:MAG: phosphomethylpyrimidine synthase ThiC [Candidatus Omnitrophota bacterium]|jgi:phosphomethylpyrimidine synthase
MTQLESAKNNLITPLMKTIAKIEAMDPGLLCQRIQAGSIAILNNNKHKLKNPCAVGYGLKTKINANIGTSTDHALISEELKKLKTAIEYGSDTVMDLSVGGDLKKTRRQILKTSTVPVGTVPIYEMAVNAEKKYGSFLKMTSDDIFDVLEEQAEDGVDFFTIHSGVTRKNVGILKKNGRVLNIVSRGGAMLAAWMRRNKKENPLYEEFDRVLDIVCKYDITLSLGDGLRPGSILDASDEAQIAELETLGLLASRARDKNVQVIIEGPGHVPLNQIRKNVAMEKELCDGAPFYVLGPLVTDVGAGYDHITAAIGGAIAASEGADFLCYVTPSEHLRHPNNDDVKEGVIASRIAGHAADLVKRVKGAIKWDEDMSRARNKRDWKKQIKLSMDKRKAAQYRRSSKPAQNDVCTMCGKYCSIKLMEKCSRA